MTVTDLAPTQDVAALRARYRAFMDEHIYPNEAAIGREDDDAHALLDSLRAQAKAEGLWAPHLPPEAGGTGSGFLAYAHLNEDIGRSTWATARSCTCSGRPSRRSASSLHSSPATCGRSSR